MAETGLPQCHVLIVSGDADWRESLCNRLRAAEVQDDEEHQCCDLSFFAVDGREGLVDRALEDGQLQCVVLDAGSAFDSLALLREVRGLRSELDVFLALPPGVTLDHSRAELLDREDTRAETLLRRLRSAIQRRARTPFADTLRD